MVRVTIVLSQDAARSDQRLLEALRGDARYDIGQVFVAARAGHPFGAADWLLGVEQSLSARRRRGAAGQGAKAHPLPSEALPLPARPEEVAPCDVLLDLSGSAPDSLAGRAATGLWRLSVDDPADGAAARAVLCGAALLPCCLCRLPAPGAPPRLVARIALQPKLLLGRSLDFLREKATQLILRELARLALTGAPADLGPAEPDRQPLGRAALPRYAARIAGEAADRVGMTLRRRLGGSPKPFSLRLGHGDLEDFDPGRTVEWRNRRHFYRADPFLFEEGGTLYCFYEAYSYGSRRGHIAVARVEGDRMEEIGPALERPYHLSYPFIFRHGGEIFLMPETHQAHRIEIWRCTDFPTGWTLHATALEGLGPADPVLFRKDDAWWLFVNLCHDSIGDLSSELHLFRTDGPDLTRMEPHPLNPVVIGSDVARGGGRIVESGGRILRASQDNSGRTYGHGLNLMEITRLSATEYEERPLRHVGPEFAPGLIGCHHVDALAGRVVIDVRRS